MKKEIKHYEKAANELIKAAKELVDFKEITLRKLAFGTSKRLMNTRGWLIFMMRKKSKNPIKKAKNEADRALQDAYRRNYPNEKCESCGQRFYCMHHHLEKAKSNFCRYRSEEHTS